MEEKYRDTDQSINEVICDYGLLLLPFLSNFVSKVILFVIFIM